MYASSSVDLVGLYKNSKKVFFASSLFSGRVLAWIAFFTFFLMVDFPLYADEKVINLRGDQLEIQVVSSRVRIDTEERGDVRFQLMGDVTAIEAIHMDVEGGKVVLKEMAESSNASVGTSSNVRIGGNVIVSGNGKVSIGTITVPNGQSQAARSLEIHVTAPQSLPLVLKSMGADMIVGKTDAPLRLEQLGYGTVQIAALRDGDIVTQGTGDIWIGRVTGRLKIQSVGTGNLTVQEGQISTLSIDLQGTGNVTVDGTAVDTSIRLTGTGNVTVGSSQYPVIAQHSGVGSIKIGNVKY